MLPHNFLQHPPVRSRHVLRDVAAPLQVDRVHSLADVVPQAGGTPPDGPLVGGAGGAAVLRDVPTREEALNLK